MSAITLGRLLGDRIWKWSRATTLHEHFPKTLTLPGQVIVGHPGAGRCAPSVDVAGHAEAEARAGRCREYGQAGRHPQ